MAQYDYDLFTIGAGSGGVRASRMAAQYGAKVGIAEEYRVGGTCVIRGCIPKKLFVYASHFQEDFEDAAAYGWEVGDTKFSWQTLVVNKDKEIDRLNQIYIRNLNKVGVEIFEERAVVAGPNTIQLETSGKKLTAKTILIATGAWPARDEKLPGVELTITSNEAFHLKELPKSILIAGGGYIAVEFAGIFNGLGVETTLLYRGNEILRGFDEDLGPALHHEMERKGVTIITENIMTEVKKTQAEDGATSLAVTLSDGRTIDTGAVMFAIGRNPNVAGLGLEQLGVELDSQGAIKVDEFSRTSVPNIYAVGDVTNRAQLTPVAIREGASFAATVFDHTPTPMHHRCIPTAVFSQPELGTVGLTEAEARDELGPIEIFKTSFTPLKHTLTGKTEKTYMKLVVDAATDRVAGVHLIGPDSGEMIQLAAIPVTMGATKAQFDATFAVHPTASEELVTMREPVAAAD